MYKYFVFDTNALISTHLKLGSVSARALDKALVEGIVVLSDSTLREFATRLARKKFDRYISTADRAEAILQLSRDCLHINPTTDIKACRDADDDKFLSLAVAVGAACLVTGDGALHELHPFRGISILSAGDFLKKF